MKMLAPAFVLLALLTGAAEPEEPFCATLTAGASTFVVDPQLHVQAQTGGPEPFKYESRSGAPVAAIMCRRTSPLPLANDYKVPEAGWPLYLQTARAITVLEKADDRYDLRLLRGTLTPSEKQLMPKRMAELNRTARRKAAH